MRELPASFWLENVIVVVIFFTIFRENVVVAETSYQKLEFLSFLRSGEGLMSFNEHNSANFSSEK